MKTAIEKRMMSYQTDSFGIVHHARYLEMMEEARWEYVYENSLMEAFHQKGIFHVIVNIKIDDFGSVSDNNVGRYEDPNLWMLHTI